MSISQKEELLRASKDDSTKTRQSEGSLSLCVPPSNHHDENNAAYEIDKNNTLQSEKEAMLRKRRVETRREIKNRQGNRQRRNDNIEGERQPALHRQEPHVHNIIHHHGGPASSGRKRSKPGSSKIAYMSYNVHSPQPPPQKSTRVQRFQQIGVLSASRSSGDSSSSSEEFTDNSFESLQSDGSDQLQGSYQRSYATNEVEPSRRAYRDPIPNHPPPPTFPRTPRWKKGPSGSAATSILRSYPLHPPSVSPRYQKNQFLCTMKRGYSCCGGDAEPPGITISEEQRMWKEAIHTSTQSTRRRRRRRRHDTTNDEPHNIHQVEVVPVNPEFQGGDFAYTEMDGVGMVFAPAKLPSTPPARAPWWERQEWNEFEVEEDDATTEVEPVSMTTSHYVSKKTCLDTFCAGPRKPSLLQQAKSPRLRYGRDTEAIFRKQQTVRQQDGRLYGPGPGNFRAQPNNTETTGSDGGRGDSAQSSECGRANTQSFASSRTDLDESLDHRISRLDKASQHLQRFRARSNEDLSSTERSISLLIPHLNHDYGRSMLELRSDYGNPIVVENFHDKSLQSSLSSESDLSLVVKQKYGGSVATLLGESANATESDPIPASESIRRPERSHPTIVIPEQVEMKHLVRQKAQTTKVTDRHACRLELVANNSRKEAVSFAEEDTIIRLDDVSVRTEKARILRRTNSSSPIRVFEDSPRSFLFVDLCSENRSTPNDVAIRREQVPAKEKDVVEEEALPRFIRTTPKSMSNRKPLTPTVPRQSPARVPLSPVRLYGDPPLPRREDGSPVASPKNLPREHKLYIDTNQDNESGIAITPSKLKELLASLSPRGTALSGLGGNPDTGAGLILLNPTINIYPGDNNTTPRERRQLSPSAGGTQVNHVCFPNQDGPIQERRSPPAAEETHKKQASIHAPLESDKSPRKTRQSSPSPIQIQHVSYHLSPTSDTSTLEERRQQRIIAGDTQVSRGPLNISEQPKDSFQAQTKQSPIHEPATSERARRQVSPLTSATQVHEDPFLLSVASDVRTRERRLMSPIAGDAQANYDPIHLSPNPSKPAERRRQLSPLAAQDQANQNPPYVPSMSDRPTRQRRQLSPVSVDNNGNKDRFLLSETSDRRIRERRRESPTADDTHFNLDSFHLQATPRRPAREQGQVSPIDAEAQMNQGSLQWSANLNGRTHEMGRMSPVAVDAQVNTDPLQLPSTSGRTRKGQRNLSSIAGEDRAHQRPFHIPATSDRGALETRRRASPSNREAQAHESPLHLPATTDRRGRQRRRLSPMATDAKADQRTFRSSPIPVRKTAGERIEPQRNVVKRASSPKQVVPMRCDPSREELMKDNGGFNCQPGASPSQAIVVSEHEFVSLLGNGKCANTPKPQEPVHWTRRDHEEPIQEEKPSTARGARLSPKIPNRASHYTKKTRNKRRPVSPVPSQIIDLSYADRVWIEEKPNNANEPSIVEQTNDHQPERYPEASSSESEDPSVYELESETLNTSPKTGENTLTTSYRRTGKTENDYLPAYEQVPGSPYAEKERTNAAANTYIPGKHAQAAKFENENSAVYELVTESSYTQTERATAETNTSVPENFLQATTSQIDNHAFYEPASESPYTSQQKLRTGAVTSAYIPREYAHMAKCETKNPLFSEPVSGSPGRLSQNETASPVRHERRTSSILDSTSSESEATSTESEPQTESADGSESQEDDESFGEAKQEMSLIDKDMSWRKVAELKQLYRLSPTDETDSVLLSREGPFPVQGLATTVPPSFSDLETSNSESSTNLRSEESTVSLWERSAGRGGERLVQSDSSYDTSNYELEVSRRAARPTSNSLRPSMDASNGVFPSSLESKSSPPSSTDYPSVSSTSILGNLFIDPDDQSLYSLLLKSERNVDYPRFKRTTHIKGEGSIGSTHKTPTQPKGNRQARLYDEQNRSIYNELIKRGRVSVDRLSRHADQSPSSLEPINEQNRESNFRSSMVVRSPQNTPPNNERIQLFEPPISYHADVTSSEREKSGPTTPSRLDRLRRLQARLHSHSHEKQHLRKHLKTRAKPLTHAKPVTVTERLNGAGTIAERLNGARQRAAKSLKRNSVGSLLKRSSPPNSPRPQAEATPRRPKAPPIHGLVEVYLQTGKSANLPPQDQTIFPSQQDAKSFASSASRRKKDLIRSLPNEAKVRNAAGARPGSLLWQATVGNQR